MPTIEKRFGSALPHLFGDRIRELCFRPNWSEKEQREFLRVNKLVIQIRFLETTR